MTLPEAVLLLKLYKVQKLPVLEATTYQVESLWVMSKYLIEVVLPCPILVHTLFLGAAGTSF